MLHSGISGHTCSTYPWARIGGTRTNHVSEVRKKERAIARKRERKIERARERERERERERKSENEKEKEGA